MWVLNRKHEDGSVTVEFVLVASVLLMILFSIVELGLLIDARLVITAAAREGARRAAIDGGASEAAYEKITEELGMGNISPDDASISISPKTASYGSYVRVTIEYEFPITTPIIRQIAGRSVRLKGCAISRSERVR